MYSRNIEQITHNKSELNIKTNTHSWSWLVSSKNLNWGQTEFTNMQSNLPVYMVTF